MLSENINITSNNNLFSNVDIDKKDEITLGKKTLNFGKIKTFNVQVPEGIRNGEKIRLVGQGKPGKNGGRNGDLFLKINIEGQNKFKINGYDLQTDLLLTPWEAALGTRTKVKSIDEESNIYIPKGIQSGEKLKIPGKGYKKGKGKRGDLIAEVKIVVPKTLSEEEKKIFEKLNKISTFDPRNTKKQAKKSNNG